MFKIGNLAVSLTLVPLIGLWSFSLALGAAFATSQAASSFSASIETAGGLHTLIFLGDQGIIRVNLPDDAAAGDTISGTVIIEQHSAADTPRGQSDAELRGYVVEIEKQKTPVQARTAQLMIPESLGGGFAQVILRDAKGREVAKTRVPVQPAPPQIDRIAVPGHGDYHLPRIGQTGRPIQIKGPFDGSFGNTGVHIGGREAELLAESPRKLVAKSPVEIVGPTEIEVREGLVVSKGEFRNVAIALTALKTSLIRGERTLLTVKVEGLQALKQPIDLSLVTRGAATAEGGDFQTVVIHPSDVQPGGYYTLTRALTGTRAGDFVVIASVPALPTVSQDGCDVKIKGEKVVCLFCEGESPSTVLEAQGTPGGGTYKWEATDGSDKVGVTPKDNKAWVKGKKPSENKEDVEVKVTYTVKEKDCPDRIKLTVLEPTSLRVKEEWLFTVKGAKVQGTNKDGKAHNGPVPQNVADRRDAVLKQDGMTKEHAGVILLRYYEVLDQFGEVMQCDGTLTEEITPSGGVKTGGTKVKQGVPEKPDHLFSLQKESEFKDQTVVQSIKVSGCVLRYNEISYTISSVSVSEITKKDYETEKKRLTKNWHILQSVHKSLRID